MRHAAGLLRRELTPVDHPTEVARQAVAIRARNANHRPLLLVDDLCGDHAVLAGMRRRRDVAFPEDIRCEGRAQRGKLDIAAVTVVGVP